ncbi:unnamed protein product [Paramecium primaurelia]|uniref:Uncharacterized protein n=1 Tax=Paramecium primaurelia TaxID=5886 RepID=A0A8S1QDA6_PARPR|nr:unnamed protein product [Paramecium primaurelia]
MKKGFKIEYNFETVQIWEESIEALQLYDPNYKQIQIKPQNLIEYVLNTIDLMAQVRGYNQDSFIIALINYCERTKKKSKSFMTGFINSFKEQINDPELSYFTQLLDPNKLMDKTPSMFKFYLKVRKYIYTNYVNPRESYIKPIKFDDWVTVVSKFLDNASIPIIGNRIRDELNNNSTDKVFKNTIQPIELLIFCYEVYENQQLDQVQKTNQEYQQKEESVVEQQQKRQTAQQLAYKMIMPNSLQKVQEDKHNGDSQQKMKFIEVIKMHENLAYNYKILANNISDTQDIVGQLIQKNQNLDFDDDFIQQLEQVVNFKSFSKNDAIKELEDSNIYDFI